MEKRVKDINAVQNEMLIDIMEQPDEIVAHVNHVGLTGPDLRMLYMQYFLALSLFFGAVTQSLRAEQQPYAAHQRAGSAQGIRGDARRTDKAEILNENLVLTLIGGVVGLVFSYLAVYGMRTLFTIVRTSVLPVTST